MRTMIAGTVGLFGMAMAGKTLFQNPHLLHWNSHQFLGFYGGMFMTIIAKAMLESQDRMEERE